MENYPIEWFLDKSTTSKGSHPTICGHLQKLSPFVFSESHEVIHHYPHMCFIKTWLYLIHIEWFHTENPQNKKQVIMIETLCYFSKPKNRPVALKGIRNINFQTTSTPDAPPKFNSSPPEKWWDWKTILSFWDGTFLWIQVPPKEILYLPNCTLGEFLAATWIPRVFSGAKMWNFMWVFSPQFLNLRGLFH